MASRLVFHGSVLGVATGLGLLLLGGCTVGPDYKRPSLWSPSAWLGHDKPAAGTAPVPSVVDAMPPDPAWWSVFHDPELTSLEQRVAEGNLDVRLATSRLAQSRAQLRITGADRYPTLNGTGQYERLKISDKEVQRGLTQAAGALPLSGVNGLTNTQAQAYAGTVTIPPLDMWQAGVDASWELDLWGRVRREVESARATLQSSAEDRRSVLIARLSEVARDYMSLRGSQQMLAIAIENRKTSAASLDLTRERFTHGLVTDLDVQNAASQLDTVSAQIPNQQQRVAQQINALSLLLGEPPQALRQELETATPVPPLPPVVPIGVPSELARRRPDIREAEARLHAATAQVGVAVADFYPRVTLTGALSLQALQARDLAFWPAAAYNFGPSISLPFFQGGRLRGQLQLSKAQEQEAAISYQRTVLSAWHDVDNALTAYSAEQQRHNHLARSMVASQRALVLAQEQYRTGLETFLNVLDAERTLLQAEQQLADSTATQSSNLVQLYNALGGGWETDFPDHAGHGTAASVAAGGTSSGAGATKAAL